MKNINIGSIVAFTNLPFILLQVVVARGQCANMTLESLVWSCPAISWQFWDYFLNNNTISIQRNALQSLPKSRDIQMVVT